METSHYKENTGDSNQEYRPQAMETIDPDGWEKAQTKNLNYYKNLRMRDNGGLGKFTGWQMKQTLADFASKIFATDADLEGTQDYHMFIDTYDNSMMSRDEVKKDMSEIKVRSNSFFRRNGRKCLPFDYFTVHYRAYIDNNNTNLEYMDKVLDSRKNTKNKGRPIVF